MERGGLRRFISALWLCLLLPAAASQVATTCGQLQVPQTLNISETDAPGTQLFQRGAASNLSLTYFVSLPTGLATELQSYFSLTWSNNAYTMRLNKTVDLEALFKIDPQPFSVVNLHISCSSNGLSTVWDPFLTVRDANEFSPYFNQSFYNLTIPEESSYGTPLLRLADVAKDDDVNPSSFDGNDVDRFLLQALNMTAPQNGTKFNLTSLQIGTIQLIDRLDFEAMVDNPFFFLNATVVDKGGLMNHTMIRVEVLDIDDQPPEFFTPNCSRPCSYVSYTAYIYSNHTGPLPSLSPAPIAARDGDTLNASVTYSIIPGSDPGKYFAIDSNTGVVSCIRAVNNVSDSEFVLMVQATETGAAKRSASTPLRVRILTTPPAGSTTTTADPNATSASGSSGDSSTPHTGASLQAAGENTILIALIVLAIFVLILVVGLIVSIVCVRKRYKRAVGPETPSTSEPTTSEDEVSLGNKEQWPPYPAPPPPGTQGVPPFPEVKDSSTTTDGQLGKKRSRRRNRNKDPELFDGTRDYEGSLDPDFFLQADKSKIKQSMRSRDLNKDPKYWITVTDDY